MKKRLLLLAILLFGSYLLLAARASVPPSARARKFDFTYRVTIKDLPPGTQKVRVWLPLAVSDDHQTVRVKKTMSPVPLREMRDPEYGNRMEYAEIAHPSWSSAEFALEYGVTRREYSKGDFNSLLRYNHEPVRATAELARFLAPDRLVPVDGKMKELADENVRGKQGAVEKARAVYEYLFSTFRYDKTGTGWGRGDALWACDAKRGNCTDFHSPFISMMRAEKIPARFEIGFPLPENEQQGEIPGYHCWAEFYVDGAGWVPVDISEAWKNQARHDYFFGSLDVNRVQFTIGRDITLSPRQSGPPLNYFIYPYVEVDGQPYDKLDKKFTFFSSAPAARNGR